MDLRLVGKVVLAIESGFQVTIRLEGHRRLTLDCPFSIDRSGRTVRLDPDNPDAIPADVLDALVGLVATRAEASDNGQLCVEFGEFAEITASADGRYEAWNVSGPDGFKVVCMPSGELAVWSPERNTASRLED